MSITETIQGKMDIRGKLVDSKKKFEQSKKLQQESEEMIEEMKSEIDKQFRKLVLPEKSQAEAGDNSITIVVEDGILDIRVDEDADEMDPRDYIKFAKEMHLDCPKIRYISNDSKLHLRFMIK